MKIILEGTESEIVKWIRQMNETVIDIEHFAIPNWEPTFCYKGGEQVMYGGQVCTAEKGIGNIPPPGEI